VSNDSQAQAERRQRGEDFQDELRRSWRLLPNCCRLRITDGVNRAGTRPGDELVLLSTINILCEAKRTAGRQFELSMLRPNQQKGLLDFDNAIRRNAGLIFISFLNEDEGLDAAYAFKFIDALRYMRNFGIRYITLEAFQERAIRAVSLTPITINGERGYDLKGVETCYR